MSEYGELGTGYCKNCNWVAGTLGSRPTLTADFAEHFFFEVTQTDLGFRLA